MHAAIDLDNINIQSEARVLIHKAVRVVESQEQIATLELTANKLDEQAVLEQLLDDNKPPYQSESKHHYLIKTPFRYPPLKNGSRFGVKSMRGIYYASLSYATAFAERAYYLFVFLEGMQTIFTEEAYRPQQNTFWVNIHAQKGIALQQPPFNKKKNMINNPSNYSATQLLGSKMRDEGIQAFSFTSARDLDQGLNVGVFDIESIRSKQPQNVKQWIVHYNFKDLENLKVSFFNPIDPDQVLTYNRNDFCINGEFPHPAV